MNDENDQTPFGTTPPATAGAPLPPPPALSPSEVAGGQRPSGAGSGPASSALAELQASSGSAEEEHATSAVAVLTEPREHFALGNDWSFGSKKGAGTAISLSGSRKSIALALVVILVALVGSYFFLNRSKSGSGTALALTLAQGQTYRYHVDMTFNGSVKIGGKETPVSTAFGETFSWEVESVDAAGVATVKMTVEDLTTVLNGASQPAGGGMSIQIKVAKDGRILTAGNLALTGGGGTAQSFPGTDQFLPLLPDHPVKPGDTWTKAFDQDFPFGNGKIHYASENTYLRDEVVNGVQAAVIGGTVKIPLDLTIDPAEISKAIGVAPDPSIPAGAKIVFVGNMNLTQTAWLDLSKHTLLKGSISGTMDMTLELQGVPAPAQIPGGKLEFLGDVNLTIRQAPASTPAPGPTVSAVDAKAQSNLRNALSAAKVYFLDIGTYVGISPKKLKGVEPSLVYNTSSKALKGAISIRDVSKDVLLLVSRSKSGKTFCVVDMAGTVVYGTQDAKKAASCSGGW